MTDHDLVAHDLYETSDPDRPDVICDRNGEVVLGLCKRCGRTEIELSEPCTFLNGGEDVMMEMTEMDRILEAPGPDNLLNPEEKLIWILGDLINAVENYFGAENPKRQGHIYCAAARIHDEVLTPLRAASVSQPKIERLTAEIERQKRLTKFLEETELKLRADNAGLTAALADWKALAIQRALDNEEPKP